MRRRISSVRFPTEWTLVTLFYSVVGAVFTWPLIVRMKSGFYGFGNDNWGGIWFINWINKTFWSGESSAVSHDIQYPFGYEFDDRYIAPYDRLISILFGGIGDGLFAYNLMIFISFPLAGVSMYALARYLTGNRSAAVFAGLVFTVSPFHLAMSMQYPAMACIFPIPLLVLAVIHAVRTRRLRDAAWAGAALALVWATSYYYGWFAIWFLLVFFVAAGLVGLWRSLLKRRVGSALREGARFAVTRGAVMGVTFSIIAIPLLINLVVKVLSDPDEYARQRADIAFTAVRPWMYFLPPHDNPLFGDLSSDFILSNLGILPVYEQSVYLGAIAVLFSLVAVFFYRRANEALSGTLVALLAGAGFCVLLTLGMDIPISPFSIDHWISPSAYRHVTGPAEILYDLSPNFRYYGRAFVFVSVVLASLAAIGYSLASRAVSSRFGVRGGQVLLVLAMSGVLIEFANIPPRHFVDLSSPPWLAAVKELPEDAQIMEFPYAGYSTPRSLQYVYWQTRHDLTTVNPPATLESQAFMRVLDDPDSFIAGRRLSRVGVDFVVVHTKLDSPTFPPYQPAWPSDQLPRSAGSRNPWLEFYDSTSDAVIYRVRKSAPAEGIWVTSGKGWGDAEVDGTGSWRWMMDGTGQILVYAARDYPRAKLEVTLHSFYSPRSVELALGKKVLARRRLSATELSTINVPVGLKKGLQVYRITATPGPVVIDDVLHNGDRRRAAIRAKKPEVSVQKPRRSDG